MAAYMHRLADIPTSTFNHLVSLFNEGHNADTLRAWFDIVSQHHQDVINNAFVLQAQPQPDQGPHSFVENATPVSANAEGRYVCQRCGEHLKYSKDFIRHAEQKCEAVRDWRCPDCSKTYKRVDRFRRHHKDDHSCSVDNCSHADDAERPIPPRAALGCGFCTCCFRSDLRGYLKHLIQHYNEGRTASDWRVTTNIESLLMQPRVLEVWFNVCANRFQISPNLWPTLSWTVRNAKEYINKLEYELSDHELHVCLHKLLEIGLDEYAYDNFSMSTTTADATKSLADVPPENIRAGAVDKPGGDDTEDVRSLASASTLVNVEQLWNGKDASVSSPSSIEWTPNTSLKGSNTFPLFSTTFHDPDDRMDLDWSTGMGTSCELDGPSQPCFVGNTLLPDIEKINKAATPSYTSDIASDRDFLSVPRTQAVTGYNSAWPTHVNRTGGIFDDPLPPFNPTPPLKGYRGHRRSISGSIWRALQSIPSFPAHQ